MIRNTPPIAANAKSPAVRQSLEEVELSLLLDGIYQVFGFDFREYNRMSIRRRIQEIMKDAGISTISALQDRVFHDATMSKQLMSSLSVQVSDFFRNPEFFSTFRQKAVPLLRTYPQIRIWHAGCSSGEEVYSM